MKKIKQFIWKLKYASHFKKIAGVSYNFAWKDACAGLENVSYDTTECPRESAESSLDAWQCASA